MKAHKLLKIDSIMYFVGDLQKGARFYQDVLGLKKVWTDESRKMIGFVFEQSDSEVVIHSDPTIPNNEWSFLVENVEEFVTEVKNLGYKVSFEPIEVRCGKYAIVSDPFDNKIPVIDLTKFGGKPKYDP